MLTCAFKPWFYHKTYTQTQKKNSQCIAKLAGPHFKQWSVHGKANGMGRLVGLTPQIQTINLEYNKHQWFKHLRSLPLSSPTHRTRFLESGKMGMVDCFHCATRGVRFSSGSPHDLVPPRDTGAYTVTRNVASKEKRLPAPARQAEGWQRIRMSTSCRCLRHRSPHRFRFPQGVASRSGGSPDHAFWPQKMQTLVLSGSTVLGFTALQAHCVRRSF